MGGSCHKIDKDGNNLSESHAKPVAKKTEIIFPGLLLYTVILEGYPRALTLYLFREGHIYYCC